MIITRLLDDGSAIHFNIDVDPDREIGIYADGELEISPYLYLTAEEADLLMDGLTQDEIDMIGIALMELELGMDELCPEGLGSTEVDWEAA